MLPTFERAKTKLEQNGKRKKKRRKNSEFPN